MYMGSTFLRALRTGRKTQFRTPLTFEQLELFDPADPAQMTALIHRCPFGRPGDQIVIPGASTVEIVEVRIERVRDISQVDAIDEGLTPMTKDGGETYRYGLPDRDGEAGGKDTGWQWFDWESDPRKAFRKVWDALHFMRPGAAWDDNPWVWAVRFRLVSL